MNVTRVKVLAAAVLVACGLASGVGSQWVATAQDPFNPLAVVLGDQDQTEEQKKYLNALQSVYKVAKDKEAAPVPKSKWEYQFLTRPVGYAPSIEKFQTTIKTVENDGGWEYVGLVNTKEGPDRETLPTLVFRRPVRVEATMPPTAVKLFESVADVTNSKVQMDYRSSYQTAVRTLEEKKNKIAALEAELAIMKGQVVIYYFQKDLPLGVSELQDMLGRVALKIGIKNLSVHVTADRGGALHLIGPKDSVEWAERLIQTLTKTTDPVKR